MPAAGEQQKQAQGRRLKPACTALSIKIDNFTTQGVNAPTLNDHPFLVDFRWLAT